MATVPEKTPLKHTPQDTPHKPTPEELHRDRMHAVWTLLVVALLFALIAVAAIWGGAPEGANYNDFYLP
ncbi:MAG: hypothetical protein V3V75_04260 [Thermoguttaceae bacterium]